MGFTPDTTVNVSLAGHGTSSWHPRVDAAGTFNYTIDQDHRFFSRDIPVGNYQVQVTGSGGRHATAKFRVDPPPAGPPPAVRPGGSTTGLPAGSTRPGRSAVPDQPG